MVLITARLSLQATVHHILSPKTRLCDMQLKSDRLQLRGFNDLPE